MASGHIEKYGDNDYKLIIEKGRDSDTGKRFRKKVTFHGSPQAAKAELRKILTEMDKGYDYEPSKLTLREYLKKWLDDCCSNELADSTCENYKIIILTSSQS
jgi:hypothetical protein